jgi:hypothetical protein
LTIKSLNFEEINLRKLNIDEVLNLKYFNLIFFFKKAIDRRDKLCIEIYLNIVNFIINKINKELFIENKINTMKRSQHQKSGKKKKFFFFI